VELILTPCVPHKHHIQIMKMVHVRGLSEESCKRRKMDMRCCISLRRAEKHSVLKSHKFHTQRSSAHGNCGDILKCAKDSSPVGKWASRGPASASPEDCIILLSMTSANGRSSVPLAAFTAAPGRIKKYGMEDTIKLDPSPGL
jgi:hypothetical protein